MMVHTGACIVFSRLPSLKCGFRRSLASFDFTNRKRAGEQLALVGPSLSTSTSWCRRSSGTSFCCHLLWVRASRKIWRSAASSVAGDSPAAAPSRVVIAAMGSLLIRPKSEKRALRNGSEPDGSYGCVEQQDFGIFRGAREFDHPF